MSLKSHRGRSRLRDRDPRIGPKAYTIADTIVGPLHKHYGDNAASEIAAEVKRFGQMVASAVLANNIHKCPGDARGISARNAGFMSFDWRQFNKWNWAGN